MKFVLILMFMYMFAILMVTPSNAGDDDENSNEGDDSGEDSDNGCGGWSDVSWNYPAMHTPNMEGLAREGVILNQTYVQQACSPTRAALLTGYYAFRAGLGRATIYPQQPAYLWRNLTTLGEALKPLGYSTHILGKWHLGSCRWDVTPTYRGYDSFFGTHEWYTNYLTHMTNFGEANATRFNYGPPYPSLYDNTGVVLNQEGKHVSELLTERAVNIISSHNPATPLYLHHGSIIAHGPWDAPQRFEDLYSNINDSSIRTQRAMISLLDECIGNITKALKAKGMWENTIFLYLSDHGTFASLGRNWPLRAGIGTAFEGAIRSPAFISGKLLEKTGYVNNEVIHVTDFFPTFLSLAGGKPDPKLDGMNIWDTLSKGSPTPRTETLQHLDVHPDSYHYVMRIGDYKLMEGQWNIGYRMPKLPFPTNRQDDWYPPIDLQDPDIPDVPGNPFPYNTTFLFNIADDPRETTDLSGSMPEKVEELRQAAQKYIETAPPTFFPELDFESGNPKNRGGIWSPGWC
ncbi:arylsulfatase B-like [Glandiceps talaboti]